MATAIGDIVYQVGAPVAIGVGVGVLAWFTEEALVSQIQDKQWVLPVLSGFAAAGAYVIIMRQT